MTIIFKIQGGLGKSIMATALVEGIKKKYPSSYLVVITHYVDVFTHNPFVKKCLHLNQIQGVYEKYVLNQDCLFMVSDPYSTNDFQQDNKHLLKIWFEINNLEYQGEEPKFYLSNAEKQFYSQVYKQSKPILVIQPNGGAPNQIKYNWSRDIPSVIVREIIAALKDKYTIIHVKRKDQITYANTLQALDGYRSIAYLLTQAHKCLLIDSFVQHLAVAMKKPSVVCWIGTNPKVFGYKYHTNIPANKPNIKLDLSKSVFKATDLVEPIEKCPYSDLNNIFDASKIIKQLK